MNRIEKNMQRLVKPAAFGLAFALAAGAALAQDGYKLDDNTPRLIANAINGNLRPFVFMQMDAGMKPAETLTFIGVKRSSRIGELNAQDGYFSTLLAGASGETGAVYAYTPRYSDLARMNQRNISWNVSLKWQEKPLTEFAPPEPLDIVVSDYNYSAGHLERNAPISAADLNKKVFAALKPGGTYVIIDYRAEPGANKAEAAGLGRSDPAQVRKEVEAAGFVFDAQSEALANPADPRTGAAAGGFNGTAGGAMYLGADRYMMRFKKPGLPADQAAVAGPPRS